MSDETTSPICPRCGAALQPGVAEGLCPACLLRQAAFGTGGESGGSAAPWTPPTVEELVGSFPQLEIQQLIGRGGMGAVYKAKQKSLGRLVALKILAPQYASNPDFAERFAREGKTLAELNHPNIVTVHDFGRTDNLYYLTMEYVDGVNLRQAISAGRLAPEQALAIVPPICEALQFAHEHGIVHRDIKPENLLLDKEGRVKIADFGIARMMRQEPIGESESAAGGTFVPGDLTRQSVLGTPQYMAPEQRENPRAVDQRADIYSLGIVLYEMLTGELPGSKLEPPSRKVQIDVRLDEVVLRALEQRPERRYQTAAEFRTGVTTWMLDQPSETATAAPFRCQGSGNITTPERLATLWGQFFAHRSRATFVLDERQLTIRPVGRFSSAPPELIPLAAIRDIGVGCYPIIVNLLGLDYVAVTYEQNHQTQRIYFTPYPSFWEPLSGINRHVADWCEAIRTAKDGQKPRLVTAGVPRQGWPSGVWPNLGVMSLLFVLFGVLDGALGGPYRGIPEFIIAGLFGLPAFLGYLGYVGHLRSRALADLPERSGEP